MVQSIFVFCYVWVNIIIRIKANTAITYPNIVPVYLKSGGKLDLLCQQSYGFNIRWSKADALGPYQGYTDIDGSSDTGFVTFAHNDGISYMRLTKNNVDISDSGSYKCSVVSGTDMPRSVDVYVLKVSSKDGIVTHAGNMTSIACSIQDSDIRAVIRWFKSDVEIQSDPSASRFKYQLNVTLTDTSTESVLTVRNIGEADVGEYVCLFELNQEFQFNNSVNLYSHPQIKPMGRSKNLAEGKVLDLNCKAWGWPLPDVLWTRKPDGESSPSLPEDPLWMDKRVSFPTNTSLRIDPIASGDRADYTCHATTTINDSYIITATSQILVRVRGKFAPILPLVGIVIELIILFVIIYIYERNRTQEREEQQRSEAAGNQLVMTKLMI